MKYSSALVVSALCLSLSVTSSAFAAPKKPFKPSDDQMFLVGENPNLICAQKNGRWVFGKLDAKKKTFRTTKEEIAFLKGKMSGASSSKIKKIQKQIKELKAANKLLAGSCAAGPQPRSTPTPAPTPFPEALSLEPLSRAMTSEDIRYLAEKAAYGFGAKEDARLTPLAAQGVAAVVSDLMTERAEDQRLIDRVIDRYDNSLGNGVAMPQNETLNGYRQAYLELAIGTDNPFLDNFTHFLFSIFTAGCDELINQGGNNAPLVPNCKNYWSLMRSIARNPALPEAVISVGRDVNMLLYLDNSTNIRGNPNENYARELQELFTMGPSRIEGGVEVPNYVEERGDAQRTLGDIYRVAKAFTGWRIAQLPGAGGQMEYRSVYSAQDHEPGPHIMYEGTAYQFNAESDEDVVRGIFANHPGVAPFFARELLEWFLTPNPPAELVQQMADLIKANGFNLREPLAVLLRSQAFYHPNYKDTVLKTSFARVVEFVRTLGLVPTLGGVANQERGVHIVNRNNDLMNLNGLQFDTVMPPSVFYYPEATWRSPAVLLGWLNVMGNILADTTVQTNNGFAVSGVLPGPGATAEQVINHVAAKLGVTLTDSQRQQLLFYMNNTANSNGTFTARAYNHANTNDQRNKGLTLYMIIGALPQVILK